MNATKLFLLTALLFLSISSCLEDDDIPELDDGRGGDEVVLAATLLQVDYQTLEFEQGYNYFASTLPYNENFPIDAIPLEVIYNSPGDFGDLALRFIPAEGVGDTLFFGTIIWAGTGDVVLPEVFESADQFAEVPSNDFLGPPSSFFRLTPFDVNEENATEAEIFGAVQQLQVVRDALNSDTARFGWFFYPRSVGIGDPAEWDYYVVILQ